MEKLFISHPCFFPNAFSPAATLVVRRMRFSQNLKKKAVPCYLIYSCHALFLSTVDSSAIYDAVREECCVMHLVFAACLHTCVFYTLFPV